MIGHIVFAGSAEPLDDDQYIGRFAGRVEQALPAEAAADEVRYTTYALIGMTSWIYNDSIPPGTIATRSPGG